MSKAQTGYPINVEKERLTAHTVWHVADMTITGNVSPRIWYKRIVTPKGSADTVAITLLSEIVYRYSPTKESKGKTYDELRKQFRGELLQKSYSELKQEFNLTKRQFEAAAQRLEELGLITRHLKHGVRALGKTLNHVLYFQLHYGRLRELTCSETWDSTPVRVYNSWTKPDVPTAPSGAVTTPERAVTEPDGATNTKSTTNDDLKDDLRYCGLA